MDPKEHEELSRLRREQERLQEELMGLGGRLRELEQRLAKDGSTAEAEEKDWVPEPILGKGDKPDAQAAPAEKPRATPPPVPKKAATPPAPEAPAPSPTDAKEVAKEEAKAAAKPKKEAENWELDLGRVWFVRAGVGLLLTGLVFLSLYAYKNWIFAASAGVKVSFFFAISLLMVVGGYFIERRKEELRQYGQVLSAGGLAAGYYTLYAAHFVPSLQIIASPIAAAILLCIWAGGMLAYAAWRQGRILAVMAIGLAYYSTVVNPSGWISLFSSLVLSASAMILLMRYRWVWVGAVGLVAAYLSHAFWLGLMANEVTEPVRATYLACTWLLFAAAMQMPQSQKLDLPLRRGLLAFNNIACWSLLAFQIPEFFSGAGMGTHEHIGWISISIGVVWMLIGATTWRFGQWRKDYALLWGFQGLVVATLGLMLEASGYSRFLLLACQACVLLAASKWITTKWIRLAATLCFSASTIFAVLEGLKAFGNPVPSWQGYFFTALFGFGFVALMRRDVDDPQNKAVANFYGSARKAVPVVFAAIPWALLIWGVMLRWDPSWALIGLCVAPLLFSTLRVFTNRRETLDAAIWSPIVLALGGLWMLMQKHGDLFTAYAPAIGLVAIFWLTSHHLNRSFKSLRKSIDGLNSSWIDWFAATVLGLLFMHWFSWPWEDNGGWLFAAPLIAIAGSGVYILTRRPSLAAILSLLYIGTLMATLAEADYSMSASAGLPILAMVAHLALTERYFRKGIVRIPRIAAGPAITIACTAFVFGMEWESPDVWLGLLAGAWLAFSFWRKDEASAILGGLIPLLLTTLITLGMGDHDEWSPYLYLLFLPAACLMVKRLELDKAMSWRIFRWIAGATGLILLSAKLSAHVTEIFDNNGTAICWGLYAVVLFTIGLTLADKFFRRFGLLYLLIAVLHILFVDVMKLDTLGRILSFMVLGSVLLLLGFLYNQYQDKIRKYL